MLKNHDYGTNAAFMEDLLAQDDIPL